MAKELNEDTGFHVSIKTLKEDLDRIEAKIDQLR